MYIGPVSTSHKHVQLLIMAVLRYLPPSSQPITSSNKCCKAKLPLSIALYNTTLLRIIHLLPLCYFASLFRCLFHRASPCLATGRSACKRAGGDAINKILYTIFYLLPLPLPLPLPTLHANKHMAMCWGSVQYRYLMSSISFSSIYLLWSASLRSMACMQNKKVSIVHFTFM
uniref:Uncharacterized protein n=1 Tax=Usnea subgracilis TaxID=2250278 RepID=A0A482G5L0_9LECA|nr:hypothetical protein [Usnea subgracilis]